MAVSRLKAKGLLAKELPLAVLLRRLMRIIFGRRRGACRCGHAACEHHGLLVIWACFLSRLLAISLCRNRDGLNAAEVWKISV